MTVLISAMFGNLKIIDGFLLVHWKPQNHRWAAGASCELRSSSFPLGSLSLEKENIYFKRKTPPMDGCNSVVLNVYGRDAIALVLKVG